MFDTLTPPELDKILRLMALYAADPRPGKIDLGVGVYRTPTGKTPVMAVVKAAEKRIWDTQDTKGYVGLTGDPAFLDAMRALVLGDVVAQTRVALCATPGGTGAVRQTLEMVRRLSPMARVWLPAPTWPNHTAIADHLGFAHLTYRYYDPATGGIDRAGMQTDLAQAQRGDVVVLHACCHNPTGADLTPDDWAAITDILMDTGGIPFVDMAYLGFGTGLERDAAGTRHIAARLPEALIAVSCSKNFGLYRERVGMILAIAADGVARDAAQGMLAHLNRQNYAFPPDHGARIVQTILNDPELYAQWQAELTTMRDGIVANRAALAQALQNETQSDRFDFLVNHQGMFSLIGADPDQVRHLRENHGIYMVADGRMNMAGLTPDRIPDVAKILARVLM